MQKTTDILILKKSLPLFSKDDFECLLDKLGLLEVLQASNGTLQHHEPKFEDIQGTIGFLVELVLVLFHEVLLS